MLGSTLAIRLSHNIGKEDKKRKLKSSKAPTEIKITLFDLWHCKVTVRISGRPNGVKCPHFPPHYEVKTQQTNTTMRLNTIFKGLGMANECSVARRGLGTFSQTTQSLSLSLTCSHSHTRARKCTHIRTSARASTNTHARTHTRTRTYTHTYT